MQKLVFKNYVSVKLFGEKNQWEGERKKQ
jgi:hypothetical protein